MRRAAAGSALLLVGLMLGLLLAPAWERVRQPPAGGEAPIPPADQGELQLFILAGQSNMSGRAPLPPDPPPAPGVYILGDNFRWRSGVEPADDPTGYVDAVAAEPDVDPAGYGPAVAFARALRGLSADPAPVGLIPCARGGTSISRWQRAAGDDTLYGACLKRLGAALPMGAPAGILFYQGEADAIDPALRPRADLDPAAYGARLARFAADLRADLGAPDLPFVFAQIGRHDAPDIYVNWEQIQAQQATVDLPCATMILTDDLPLQDEVHLTREGYDQLGARLATAVVALRADGCG